MANPLDQLSADERRFLSELPEDGSTVGNLAMRRRLGWDQPADTDRYWQVRDALEDAGLAIRGKGKGGTVRRVTVEEAAPVVTLEDEVQAVAEEVEAAVRGELDLYDPMRAAIAGDWARDHRSTPLTVEITAQQGRRLTGGIWSRPDIVSVEVRAFEYVPGKHVELVTFEVKPSNAINVQAVYEALAHRRSATRSYVLLHVPAEERDRLEPLVADVSEVARAHGIGVVTAEDPSDYQTWEEKETAVRVEPDPERLDNFIATQLSESTRRLVSLALR